MYHLCLLCFIGLLGPFAFFDVSKTKLLQLLTSALRWTSFLSMIIMSIIRISTGHAVTPVSADFTQLPNLFGVAVYSFMCQHSLPGMKLLKLPKILLKFMLCLFHTRRETVLFDLALVQNISLNLYPSSAL